MRLDIQFKEEDRTFDLNFGEVQELTDGGYDLGYEAGKTAGIKIGYDNGKEEGIEEGYDVGKAEGLTAGYNQGKEAGMSEGYESGKTDGIQIGYDQGKEAGIEIGAKTEYDKLWDMIQPTDDPTSYLSRFKRWSRDVFFPKRDLICTNFTEMFQFFEQYNEEPFDLAQRLEDCGRVLDTSRTTNGTYVFYFTSFSRLPHIDLSSYTSTANWMFAMNRHLERIDKITSNPSIVWTNAFACTGVYSEMPLKHVLFDGTIGNSIDFKCCPYLTEVSVDSIIGALMQLAAGDSARTVAFHANVKNRLTAGQKAIIYEKGWTLV